MDDIKFKISDSTRKNIDERMVEFYFEQAERELQTLYDVSYKTTTVGYLLLSGIIALMGIFCCLVAKELDFRITFGLVAAMLLSLSVALALLLKVLGNHRLSLPGRDPSTIDFDKYVDYYTRNKEESMHKNAMIDELSDYARRIQSNIAINNRRTRNLGYCVNTLIIGLIFITLSTFLSCII